MMEIARGCPETGWVVALTAGHPLILANFPLEGQAELYGPAGEFRCPAAFNPPGSAVPVAGRLSRHRLMAVRVGLRSRHASHGQRAGHRSRTASRPRRSSRWCSSARQYRIVDDWHVMGMQGTGSKRIVAEDAFVPAQRTIFAVAPGRGSEPAERPGLHANPMYLGRIASFLIAESAAVAVGAARGALDLYEEVLRVKRTYHPPYHERFRESRRSRRISAARSASSRPPRRR